MARYFYTARSRTGQLKSGTREANNEHDLATLLRQEGYFLVRANLQEQEKKSWRALLEKLRQGLPALGSVSLKEKMFFTRNLRVMVNSGIALPRALRILAEQTKSKKLNLALLDIADKITKGKSFSQSLSEHSDIFSELFQNMIKVGEESGTLEEVLRVLTEQMEKEHELRSRIMSALIYPAVIVTAMFGIGILMLVIVVPRLAETFRELGVELPATTRFVIFLGTFLSEKWYLVALIIFILAIFFRVGLRSVPGKKLTAFVSLRTPLIADLVKKSNSAATARTLSSLMLAGVPIVRSLEIISRTLGNYYFRNALIQATERVRKGEKLASALKPYQNLYPSLVLEMIEVGEETGETSSMLAKLADFYEEEVGTVTKNLSAVIEPLLMLFIGGVVGFFAISMVQPMYAMLQAVQ